MDPNLVVPFGRYVLQERLAQGGMGEVFRAIAVGEHGFEKPVVVKRVLPAHAGRDDLADLFVAEAKLMTRLAHPNIVEVFDFGRGEHKDYYLVLELVEGTDLGRLMRAVAARAEAFPISLALFIASQVLRGLHHAHTRSATEGAVIVHRDVSPSNVLCSAEGEVKIADFGVALVTRVTEPRDGRGGVVGKPGYIAPEQLDGGALDARADIFSVGVVLHQMLTGELPFKGEGLEAQHAAASAGERLSVLDRRPEAGEAVDAIVAKALAPARDDRWPDARAMAHAIEKLRDQGQPLASGDDLAEAVRAAQRELPSAARPVIALSGASVAADDEPRELTRTGTGDGAIGAFTLRFPVRAESATGSGSAPDDPDALPAEPKTERIEPAPPSAALEGNDTASAPESGAAPSSTRATSAPARPDSAPKDPEPDRSRAPLVLGLGAAALVALVAFLSASRGLVGTSAAPVAPPAPPSVANLQPTATPTTRARASEPPAPSAPSPAPSGVVVTVSPSATATNPPARPSVAIAAPIAMGTASAASPAGCSGEVAFASDGSWVVSGGPARVQTPAIVTWPCGVYTITARSRFDPPEEKTSTVSVAPLQRASVDLRR